MKKTVFGVIIGAIAAFVGLAIYGNSLDTNKDGSVKSAEDETKESSDSTAENI